MNVFFFSVFISRPLKNCAQFNTISVYADSRIQQRKYINYFVFQCTSNDCKHETYTLIAKSLCTFTNYALFHLMFMLFFFFRFVSIILVFVHSFWAPLNASGIRNLCGKMEFLFSFFFVWMVMSNARWHVLWHWFKRFHNHFYYTTESWFFVFVYFVDMMKIYRSNPFSTHFWI